MAPFDFHRLILCKYRPKSRFTFPNPGIRPESVPDASDLQDAPRSLQSLWSMRLLSSNDQFQPVIGTPGCYNGLALHTMPVGIQHPIRY
jgi:hypothetical protein